jgi:hypothetical protein
MIKIKIDMDLEKEYWEEYEKQRRLEMEKLADELAEETPIDTGEARNGWYVTENSIENDVAHIEELNQGTSRQAPTRFIEKTLLSHPGVKPSGTIVRSK